MSNIYRFDILVVPEDDYTCAYAEHVTTPSGAYVHYDDHAAEITRLESALAAERADCARAKESLDERCKTIIEQRTRIDFLDPYCKRLEEELAAEREKVAGLADRVRGLEAFIDKVFVHWSFDNDQQHTHTWHTREDLRAEYAALTPPAPAKAAREGGCSNG